MPRFWDTMVPFYVEGEPRAVPTPTPVAYQTPVANTPDTTPAASPTSADPGGDTGGDGDDGIGAVEVAGGVAAAAAIVGVGGYLYVRNKRSAEPAGGTDAPNSD